MENTVEWNQVIQWIENDYKCLETARYLRENAKLLVIQPGLGGGFIPKTINLADPQLSPEDLPPGNRTLEVVIEITEDLQERINIEAIKAGLRHIFRYLPQETIEVLLTPQ